MAKYKTIKFVIDGFTPMTMPIGRLAEYLKAFAFLVGPNSGVRFVKVGKGSAALTSLAPPEIAPDVRGRILAAKTGSAAAEANKGFVTLRALLNEDQTTGRIKEDRSKIIEFPRTKAETIGVTEEASLEGIVIRVGGRGETIPVHIQDGAEYYKCYTTRTRAKELAPYLFGNPIRVRGQGKWTRNNFGTWELTEFRISGFEELNNDEIEQVFARMRQAQGSGWDSISDPLAELERLRKGSDKIQ